MRKIIVVPVALLGLACGTVAEEDPVAVRSYIEATNAKLEGWYRTGQVDSIASVFAEDTWQMPGGMPPSVGREAFHGFWSAALGAGTWSFTLTTQDVIVSGGVAGERGTYTLDYVPGPDAPPALAMPIQDQGNYVVVWRKDADGQWRILWDAPVSTVPPTMVSDTVSGS